MVSFCYYSFHHSTSKSWIDYKCKFLITHPLVDSLASRLRLYINQLIYWLRPFLRPSSSYLRVLPSLMCTGLTLSTPLESYQASSTYHRSNTPCLTAPLMSTPSLSKLHGPVSHGVVNNLVTPNFHMHLSYLAWLHTQLDP